MKVASNMRVAFQGERGAFSEEAAVKLLGGEVRLVPLPTFEAAFGAIAKGAADYILAPIENSLAGPVHRSFDLLVESPLTIVGEVIIRIAHILIGPPGGTIEEVTVVESHPVALAQCERFFSACPGLKRIARDDTAGSVREIVQAGDRTRAAIASKRAAKIYGGQILSEHLEDDSENYTRFLLLAPATEAAPEEADKLSLVFRLAHLPGALYYALEAFARRNINLMEIVRITSPFNVAARNFRPDGSILERGKGVSVGGAEVIVAAGPCAVESAEQIGEIAVRAAQAGAKLLRGGAFKPRSSPYSFQGLGEQGLKLLREAADKNGLLVVSEVMDPSQIEMMLPYVDVMQVGARNMQNYYLLRALGENSIPVLLKRGMSATIEELLLSAEYIMSGGNYNVMLCERGIRTFDTYMRNTMDIAAIPVIKQLSHLPVIADPSHGTGRRDKAAAMARAAVAAGADGLLIEVHEDPERALSDGAQSLYPDQSDKVMDEVRMIAPAVGRQIAGSGASIHAAKN